MDTGTAIVLALTTVAVVSLLANFCGWCYIRRMPGGPYPFNWRVFFWPDWYFHWIDSQKH